MPDTHLMTNDNELLRQIAQESTGNDSGDLSYGGGSFKEFPARYKVWNRDPGANYGTGEGDKKATPGIVMMTETGASKETRIRQTELTEKVRAVILFKTEARKLATGSGKFHRTLCQSHDGIRPSLRIEQPLCRKATVGDVAQVFSSWKNYDKARIDGAVEAATDGTDKLQMCAIRASNGTISLCPAARRDPLTGKAGPCKPEIYLHCYDVDRKREFTMTLGGRSIFHGDFIAPVHDFFRFLHTSAPQVDGQPRRGMDCYAFSLELSAAQDGAYYYLNVSNWKPIVQAENRAQMRELAVKAKATYEKQASWVPKSQLAKENPVAVSKPEAPITPAVTTPSAAAAPDSPPFQGVQKEVEISFEEDDIPF